MKILSNKDITRILREVAPRVTVNCDDEHGHNALDCDMRGDPKDILICQLAETIRYERRQLLEGVAELLDAWRGK